ncbi:MAG: hypothetical protein R3A10_08545 [Caldilineaceae bacterium]
MFFAQADRARAHHALDVFLPAGREDDGRGLRQVQQARMVGDGGETDAHGVGLWSLSGRASR